MSLQKSKDFYDRNLKERKYVPITTFSFLFGEMVQYMQSKSSGDKDFDLEEKLSSLGYPIGEKVLELCSVREKNFKKETKIVQCCNLFIIMFGKCSLENKLMVYRNQLMMKMNIELLKIVL